MTAEIRDVVVVGAGLSGLSAAHLLQRRNDALKILILEGKGETSVEGAGWLFFVVACLFCY